MPMNHIIMEPNVKGTGGLWGGSNYEKLKEQYGAPVDEGTGEVIISNDYSPLYNPSPDQQPIRYFNDRVMTFMMPPGQIHPDQAAMWAYWGWGDNGFDVTYGMKRASDEGVTKDGNSPIATIPPTNKLQYTSVGDPMNAFVPNVMPSTNAADYATQFEPTQDILEDFQPDSVTGPMGEVPGVGSNSKASTFDSALEIVTNSRFQWGKDTLGTYLMGRSSDAWYGQD